MLISESVVLNQTPMNHFISISYPSSRSNRLVNHVMFGKAAFIQGFSRRNYCLPSAQLGELGNMRKNSCSLASYMLRASCNTAVPDVSRPEVAAEERIMRRRLSLNASASSLPGIGIP